MNHGGGDPHAYIGHGIKSQRPEEALVIKLDAVALVGADEPLGRVCRRLVQGRVGGGVGLYREALLVAVVNGGLDLCEGRLEGTDGTPLKLCVLSAISLRGSRTVETQVTQLTTLSRGANPCASSVTPADSA